MNRKHPLHDGNCPHIWCKPFIFIISVILVALSLLQPRFGLAARDRGNVLHALHALHTLHAMHFMLEATRVDVAAV
jgi:hypothetical protein